MERFGRHRALWITAAGAVVLALAAGWLLIGRGKAADSKSPHDDQEPVVTVINPHPASARATVQVTGTLSARNEIPVGPQGDSGRIAAVLVDVGQRVRRGQELARLDPSVAEAQVAAMRASLEQLRAAAAVAQAENARAQRARDAFSVEEAERRRTTAVTAEAQVRVAEAQLAQARTRLDYTHVLAPADGLVLTRAAEVGQIVVPGSSVLFRIAQNSEVELRAQVAEQDVPRLAVGQPVDVRLNGVERSYHGRVWQIGAIIDSTSRQGSVRIALADRDVNLRPGAFAQAEVLVAAIPGLIVPQTAVLSDDEGNFSYVVGPDDKVVRRSVQVRGAHPDGLLLEGGLERSDRVVAMAGAFLHPGEKVHVDGQAPMGGPVGNAMSAP